MTGGRPGRRDRPLYVPMRAARRLSNVAPVNQRTSSNRRRPFGSSRVENDPRFAPVGSDGPDAVGELLESVGWLTGATDDEPSRARIGTV